MGAPLVGVVRVVKTITLLVPLSSHRVGMP
jgi:hypothetical protein